MVRVKWRGWSVCKGGVCEGGVCEGEVCVGEVVRVECM